VVAEISFSLSRRESDRPTGFELGDLTIAGPLGTATSIGKTPDQGMMIYIAIGDLMSGVARLMSTPARRYELVGADSSYIVLFEKHKSGRLVLRQGRQVITDANIDTVARSLLAEADRFWKEHPLDRNDSCYGDFLLSREQLSRAIRESQTDGR
jgi:hypothetical protein